MLCCYVYNDDDDDDERSYVSIRVCRSLEVIVVCYE